MSRDFTAFLVEESFSSVVLNWWVLVLFVTIAVMVTLGLNQFHVRSISSGKRNVSRKTFGNGVYKAVTTASTIVFAPLFIFESGPMLFAWMASFKSSNDSLFWVIVLTVVLVLAIVTIYAFAVYYVGRIAGLARRGWILESIEKRKKRK
ncbi:hypothetical protein IIY59_01125 [Candidatus Saccharibacteria bacterium]|nr:hypothetical protein [Candidatus Saccharibacteria bacterium]MBR2741941.1 hypothetical protein [Candidatus Saccharibacteria bacterium]